MSLPLRPVRLATLVLSAAVTLSSLAGIPLPARDGTAPEINPTAYVSAAEQSGASYIKWVDFAPSAQALSDTLAYDVDTYGSDHHVSWVDLLACLAARSGGNFASYSKKDLDVLTTRLEANPPVTPADLTQNQKLYAYYREAYGAVLGGMVGEYTTTVQGSDPAPDAQSAYGLRVFSPIAAGFSYQDYDDFGQSRSYGYKRSHLGHDLLGSVGTPIIAIESGYVENCGWNQYGGWRVGIRSMDGKRYYYYAHLRAGHPYHDMYKGKRVDAGEVIGYLGMTGYSRREDVNGISIPHLHVGLQLIFHPSQIEGYNQIWVDLYALTAFLSRQRVTVERRDGSDERFSKTVFRYPEMEE